MTLHFQTFRGPQNTLPTFLTLHNICNYLHISATLNKNSWLVTCFI